MPLIDVKNLVDQVKGGAPVFLKRSVANPVLSLIRALANIKVQVPQTDGQSVQNMTQADVKMTREGITITLPAVLNPQSAGSNSANTVPFSGAGAPSATTLSSAYSYVAGSTPSLYVDMTGLALYVCTTSGTNTTSVWGKISGGSGSNIIMYDTSGSTAYTGGTIAFVTSKFILSGITVLPGTYALLTSASVPAAPTGNQIPQIPVPTSGTIYWIPIAAGLLPASSCASGSNTTIYANVTSPF